MSRTPVEQKKGKRGRQKEINDGRTRCSEEAERDYASLRRSDDRWIKWMEDRSVVSRVWCGRTLADGSNGLESDLQRRI